jgi:hypothetical protein
MGDRQHSIELEERALVLPPVDRCDFAPLWGPSQPNESGAELTQRAPAVVSVSDPGQDFRALAIVPILAAM